MRTLELLAPAKNLECGKAAIDHRADAVYIGAPRFGARAAAGNSLDDIEQLCQYAHQFGAKVHVTVNTIIYDDELEDTLHMIAQLDEIGVDALLLQDMGVLREVLGRDLWHGELHSSTQCDARSARKAQWLYSLGFKRVVLARELSLDEIRSIHQAVPDVELEVFVHGALCVSYSGVCYASERCFMRSANRGECAQFCRMKFNLVDSDGREIEHDRHLLSLKDLCQIDSLEQLAEAGASSFKIEGRLKDIYYVKNVVAAYSERLDRLVAEHPGEYRRASFGVSEHHFEPNLKKTFNRGYTHYFLNGRQPDIASFDTPKAMGEYVGKVKEIRGNISFNVASVSSFANGDGLCFINDEKELEGFRVNRVEGNRLYPHRMPENLRPGMALYRNNDQAFEKLLGGETAVRKIPIIIRMKAVEGEETSKDYIEGKVESKLASGVEISVLAILTHSKILDASHHRKTAVKPVTCQVVDFFYEMSLQQAKRQQGDNMRQQLSKLGNTIFSAQEVVLEDGVEKLFIPNSVLSILRRKMVEETMKGIRRMGVKKLSNENPLFENPSGENLSNVRRLLEEKTLAKKPKPSFDLAWQPEYAKWTYLYNVANESAKEFYQAQGLANVSPAYELRNKAAFERSNSLDKGSSLGKGSSADKGESLIMQCRHCLRYSLGFCVKRGGEKPRWREPLYLELGDGRRFRLEFKCSECQMNILT